MSQITHLHALCDALTNHIGISHWAISMRIFGKGDWFRRGKEQVKRKDCQTKTADRALQWFDQNWPSDLEWPADIPRPDPKKEVA